MSLILSGTDGLSDVDGTAATPAIRGTDANTGIFFPAADTIAFSEGGVEAMRLDSSGNLGLGVTPSAWNSSSRAIQIGSSVSPYFSISQLTTSTSDGYITWGGYLTGYRTFAYLTTGDAVSTYRQNGGVHAWFNAPSGTAGNTITFTQAMTLSAAGGLSIGTTADAGAGNILLPGTNGTIFGSATTGSRSYIEMYNSSTGNMTIAATYSTAAITFATGGTTTPSERARITSTGDLLVGTTSNGTGAKTTSAGGVGITNPTSGRFATIEYGSGASGSFGTITISFTVNSANSSVILETQMTGYSGVYMDRVDAQYSNQAAVVMRNNASGATGSFTVNGAVTTYTLTISTSVIHPVVKVKATVGGLGTTITLPTITFA